MHGHYEVRAQIGTPGIGKQVIVWQGDGQPDGIGLKAQDIFKRVVAILTGATGFPGGDDNAVLHDMGDPATWTEVVLEGPNGLFDSAKKATPHAAPHA